MGDTDRVDDARPHSQHAGPKFDRDALKEALARAIREQLPSEQVMAAAQLVVSAELQVALEGRAVIDQAKGILMAERRCTADEAFNILRDISQRSQTKLHHVAQALVDSATEAPVAAVM
ncbi:MAG: histidine kinase [Pseudonocardiales bacterium]|nr:histidine kinase [Pseudonocardiales bacterium]